MWGIVGISDTVGPDTPAQYGGIGSMISIPAGISSGGRADLAAVLGSGRRFVTTARVVDGSGRRCRDAPAGSCRDGRRRAGSGRARRISTSRSPSTPSSPAAWSEDALVVATAVWPRVVPHRMDVGEPLGADRPVVPHHGRQDGRAGPGIVRPCPRSRLSLAAHVRRLAGLGDEVGVAREVRSGRRPRTNGNRHPRRPDVSAAGSVTRRNPLVLSRQPRPGAPGRLRRQARQPHCFQAPRLYRGVPWRARDLVAAAATFRPGSPARSRRATERAECAGSSGSTSRSARGARMIPSASSGSYGPSGRSTSAVIEKDYLLGWLLAGIADTIPRSRHLGVQGRHLPAQVLLRDLPALGGPRLHRDRGRPRRAGGPAPDFPPKSPSGSANSPAWSLSSTTRRSVDGGTVAESHHSGRARLPRPDSTTQFLPR